MFNKLALMIALMLIATSSFAGTAKWTNRFQQVDSDKANVLMWACEYKINGRKYIRIHEYYCASEVEIHWEN